MKKSTSNATYDIQYHFVWIPKYRKTVWLANQPFVTTLRLKTKTVNTAGFRPQ